MAIVRPIVECNRTQVDNGRTYLREIVFGDPEEPHHRAALIIVAQTEDEIAALLRRDGLTTKGEAATLAHIVSAVMFLAMAASPTSPPTPTPSWTTFGTRSVPCCNAQSADGRGRRPHPVASDSAVVGCGVRLGLGCRVLANRADTS